MAETKYQVRATRCAHDSDDASVLAALRGITDPLTQAWAKLESARTIAIKINMVWPPERIRMTAGRRQELVDESVIRALFTLLRERTAAQIAVVDTSLEHDLHDLHFMDLLGEYGVSFVNANEAPARWADTPDGGTMFGRYFLPEAMLDADATISLATLKSHNFMGVTLCTKNLFGLCPVRRDNRPRHYFHHIVRLSYALPDLAAIMRPTLNIVDGLVAQSGVEWGGDPRITDCLLAGDHTLATDVCGATLMGNDPYGDFPTPPYRRDRNHLLVGAEKGWGPSSLDQIDFQHDLSLPVAQFDSNATDPPERVAAWHRSMNEQALHYAADPAPYLAQYPHEYILLQDGVVLWHGEWYGHGVSRRDLAAAKPDRAIWLKYVDPDETEAEHFEVYRHVLGGEC
ncbi:MAG: DUF362 domain-containing protein [Armatimonadetes bacterium]|nr:DUF362 domain-containing protein [Armatimonadota bacterium]